ncbi:Predicted dienelactone hydrolase [Rhizobium sp. RU35A]|uniref:alpha/beta hydrolase family protein n=1 Tax=Rhizobium sp. RU35A TaxID=1907414 RepID=UPI0009558604|nr:alpha/beta hydrolase [Rhizobium sp. RU35A]SIP99696.1 Predicted dienelactone hydrolase [Rhizobium sp. RU35A]
MNISILPGGGQNGKNDVTAGTIGFAAGLLLDEARSNWSGDGPRPVRWSAWYPAAAGSLAREIVIPPRRPLYSLGLLAPEAPVAASAERYPVVLISHGTGGSASGLGWLAAALAEQGFVVIGADHHGNTGVEAYRAEGFLCWWERARDLTVLLDRLSEEGALAGRLDLENVSAAGFSLGGYTALALAGAITEVERMMAFVAAHPETGGPQEMPDLAAQIEPLLSSSAVFRASWERQSHDYRDERIRAVVTMAAAPPVRGFTETSLRALHLPVTLLCGEADREAPYDLCSAWLNERLPSSRLISLGKDVGHYTLLPVGTETAARSGSPYWSDMPGVVRAEVHANAVDLTLAAIRAPSA